MQGGLKPAVLIFLSEYPKAKSGIGRVSTRRFVRKMQHDKTSG
jgi:hypothetical protein